MEKPKEDLRKGSVCFGTVKRAEAAEIEERRKIAVPEADPGTVAEPGGVGLALSGGGIRSAIFNLGLIQAFSHRGLLRFVDYISSVSGGGYIAGYLASQTNATKQNFHESERAKLGIDPRTGKQITADKPEDNYRFRGPADYLSDLIGWGWRYVASTALMLALFWSALIFIGAALALIWRTFDYQPVRSYLTAINLSDFGNELTYAFLPCILLLGITGLGVLLRLVSTCGSGLFCSMTILSLLSGILGSVLAGFGWVMAGWSGGWPNWNVLTRNEWYVLMPLFTMGALSFWLCMTRMVMRAVWSQSSSRRRVSSLWVLWFLPSWGLGITTFLAVLFHHGDGVAHAGRLVLLLLVVSLQHSFYRIARDSDPAKFERRFDTALYWLALGVLIAAGVSVAIFMGNGEATISNMSANLQLNNFVTWMSAIVLFLQLVPLLGLDRLLRSNREEAPIWQKRFFGSIVAAALLAPAFFVVHWMARENISEYADYRDPKLEPNDVMQWPAFLDLLDQYRDRIREGDLSQEPTFAKAIRVFQLEVNAALRWVDFLDVLPGNQGRTLQIAVTKEPPYITQIKDLKSELNHLLSYPDDLVFRSHVETWEADLSVRGAPEWERREFRPFGTWSGTARSAGLTAQHILGLDAQYYDGPEPPASLAVYREKWERHESDKALFVERFNENVLDKPGLTYVLLHEIVVRAGSYTDPDDPNPASANSKGQANSTISAKVFLRPLRETDVDFAAVAGYAESLRQKLAEKDPSEAKVFKTSWDRLTRANLPGLPVPDALPTFDEHHWQPQEIARFNRLLLEALYPGLIRARTMVSTPVVTHRDQVVRVLWFFGGLSMFVVLLMCVDFNHNSPFYWFYWRRLKRFFLDKHVEVSADVQDPARLLADLNTCQQGLPYFLFAGTLMLRKKHRSKPEAANQLFLFSQHYCGTKEVGYCPTEDYRVYEEHPAGELGQTGEKSQGRLRLADAMTISGSAITPYMAGNRTALSILMTAFNLRLGQWLPHPDPDAIRCKDREPRILPLDPEPADVVLNGEHEPAEELPPPPAQKWSLWAWLNRDVTSFAPWFWSALAQLKQGVVWPFTQVRAALGWLTKKARPWFPAVSAGTAFREYLRSFQCDGDCAWQYGFVADGGYREFLGMEELLRRRCRLIICSDAGFNTGIHEFGSLSAMMRMARQEEGIEFLDLDHEQPISIDRFRHDEATQNRVPQQILCMRIIYPEIKDGQRVEGLLFYVQMALTGREEVDLQHFRHRNPEFPEEPTTNQNFTADQVESYRQLGAHIGSLLCKELPPALDAPPEWQLAMPIKRLSYEVLLRDIERRLLLGYQWECYREITQQREDVQPESLFADAEQLRLPDDKASDPFSMSGKDPEEWLSRYCSDANFRNYHRRRIVRLIAGPEPPRPAMVPSAGHLVVTVAAIHQWMARPGDSSESTGDDPKVALMAIGDDLPRLFQVGGRERLIAACQDFRKDILPMLQPGQEILEFRSRLFNPRTRLLTEIATNVFRTRGDDTGVLLLRKGLSEWQCEFNPKFYWDPDEMEALKQAMRTGDPNAVQEVMNQLEEWTQTIEPVF